MLIRLIRFYQSSTAHWPPVCRFTPSCSHYAIHAIERYGAVKGSAMALWRICRCHPFSRGGHDPVP
ncbi:MAG: membrane protein insertion efficiency factor YidD [Armatimonadetes bacterium]|nr:membrane protein insertion efficiency factor YidD [Armatimonadota bacterium]